ncbi:cytochrome c and c1 heme-lyase [Dacryopinax primogenitus]|uniref:Holocytochrome c-type synthase n=1 Tax=Dacryopinax primogenitus (strain DJM 731) TaxID=1858805 RepID=M5FSU6_DACPD|nr:cytochrome c and c1 heme-lyase [Dacryopinax primogenitus]EJT98354.1 cytochrome c and c1 heme-lyase [Dacryopinax primogenitus]
MSSPSTSSPPEQAKCPVDHNTRAAWLAQHTSGTHPTSSPHPSSLPTERETSSIPRTDTDSNWVYPSQSQFYSAMSRKHSQGAYASPPDAGDMPVVVPIHNAVNERAWGEVLAWERGRGGEVCGGVKLHSFKGKPREKTWRAWGRVMLGYQAPFDRHDWIVDRCGHQIRYIIDFYAGRPTPTPSSGAQGTAGAPHPMKDANGQVSFFLDVRPAPDTWEGVSMQAGRMWAGLWGR